MSINIGLRQHDTDNCRSPQRIGGKLLARLEVKRAPKRRSPPLLDRGSSQHETSAIDGHRGRDLETLKLVERKRYELNLESAGVKRVNQILCRENNRRKGVLCPEAWGAKTLKVLALAAAIPLAVC
jgi:hypothetical protein